MPCFNLADLFLSGFLVGLVLANLASISAYFGKAC